MTTQLILAKTTAQPYSSTFQGCSPFKNTPLPSHAPTQIQEPLHFLPHQSILLTSHTQLLSLLGQILRSRSRARSTPRHRDSAPASRFKHHTHCVILPIGDKEGPSSSSVARSPVSSVSKTRSKVAPRSFSLFRLAAETPSPTSKARYFLLQILITG
ncbi:hypothetical protein N656DRAFT_189435 [Canariomyces notabilis]|uniref:Uncharacterized protein n=1 Tax=Canariomyces notabilis TaxID=2074819 RepID=A0AAN6QKC1_9PEZI|nr:hypothetical protein N656DRAFT_189435 [Canariomyces arenarius]